LVPALQDVRQVKGDIEVLAACEVNAAAMLAFDEISVVDGSLELSGSTGLTSLEGLNRIISVGGDFVLENNADLANLNALDGQRLVVGGDLLIRNNNQLTSIAGLSGITVEGELAKLSYVNHVTHCHTSRSVYRGRQCPVCGLHL
jgi:hypothetical protein